MSARHGRPPSQPDPRAHGGTVVPSSYQSTFRADLTALYERLKPATIGCFNPTELSFLPLLTFVRGGSRVWFIDWNAGHVQSLLAGERTANGCLACEADLDGGDVCAAYVGGASGSCCERAASLRGDEICTQYSPGRRLRVINGDSGRGRGAMFATRAEGLVASAARPAAAVEAALSLCQSSERVEVPLPLQDGSLDLAIAVLTPARLLQHPFEYFRELLDRRFGDLARRPSRALADKLEELQLALFRVQLDAHVRELARVLDARLGRLYFATVPTEKGHHGSWPLERGVTECFDALARYFLFDFETFPAEAFLRRAPEDRAVVLQAALLQPKPTQGVTG